MLFRFGVFQEGEGKEGVCLRERAGAIEGKERAGEYKSDQLKSAWVNSKAGEKRIFFFGKAREGKGRKGK